VFDWSAFIFPTMALVKDDAIAIYGVDDHTEPHDFLVLSIKPSPREFLEILELFGDSNKRVEVARG
jgi:hypothetical protein